MSGLETPPFATRRESSKTDKKKLGREALLVQKEQKKIRDMIAADLSRTRCRWHGNHEVLVDADGRIPVGITRLASGDGGGS